MDIEGPKIEVPEALIIYLRKMRKLQKEWFKVGRQLPEEERNNLLAESKSAERAVDLFLSQLPATVDPDEPQKALF